jgi:hypothetical protein
MSLTHGSLTNVVNSLVNYDLNEFLGEIFLMFYMHSTELC